MDVIRKKGLSVLPYSTSTMDNDHGIAAVVK